MPSDFIGILWNNFYSQIVPKAGRKLFDGIDCDLTSDTISLVTWPFHTTSLDAIFQEVVKRRHSWRCFHNQLTFFEHLLTIFGTSVNIFRSFVYLLNNADVQRRHANAGGFRCTAYSFYLYILYIYY